MSYRLRASDLEYVHAEASMYAEHPTGFRNWFPIETIPLTDKAKWYTLNRIVQAALSNDGSTYVGVRTARTEDSAPIVWQRYKVEWTITEVEAARRNGVPLQADDFRVATSQMERKTAQLILEGLDVPDVINGLTEDGTDLGATLDAIFWGTADQAIKHADAWYTHMMNYGYPGPYNWIVSTSLMGDLKQPVGTSGLNQGEYIERAFNCRIFPEVGVTTASFDASEDAETIYPFRWTADDGIWVAIDPKPQNMSLMEFFPPRLTVNPNINRETNHYEAYLEWGGTLAIKQCTACGFMEDVDLVA